MSTDFEFLPLKATIISPSPSPISFFGYKNGIKDARGYQALVLYTITVCDDVISAAT